MIIFKCPACGGNMVFDSEKQKLFCENCHTTRTVEEMDVREQEESTDETIDQTEDQAKFHRYKCPSCGAELLTDEYTAATFCTFCQSSTLVEDRLEGEKAPAQLIAFKTSKEDAKQTYLKWAKKGALTPADFVKSSTVEKITGIYVPFWLYDYDTDTSLHVEATRVRKEQRGNTEYIHTDYYDVYREVAADFVKIPADASAKMEDGIMDKLEPFHYGDLKKFEMPYLSGFYAERYNFLSDELKQRVEKRVRDYAHQGAMDTVQGYATKMVRSENISLNEQKAEYVLFPVWMLNYRYKGRNFLFTMNGQTGKVVGELPISRSKMAGWFVGVFAASFLLLNLIGRFL